VQVYYEEQNESGSAEPLLAAVEGLDAERLVAWLALPADGTGGGAEGTEVPPQVTTPLCQVTLAHTPCMQAKPTSL
jgi:hypothetical protein